MQTVESLRVRNLRSFGSSGEHIPFKKLNILVGRNSCGKSTFLRTFPLLRQSVQADTRSPILWYGSYVDFGDLRTATNTSANEVIFDFKINIVVSPSIDAWDSLSWAYARYMNTEFNEKPAEFSAELSLGISEDNGEIVTNVVLKISHISICYKYKGLDVLELSIESELLNKKESFKDFQVIKKGRLIPTAFLKAGDVPSLHNIHGASPRGINKEMRTQLIAYLDPFLTKGKGKNKNKIFDPLSRLTVCPESDVSRNLRAVFSGDKLLNKSLLENSGEISSQVFFCLIGMNYNKLLEAADKSLEHFYSGVRYLGPVRASAERFYRHQDLQVAEVDHTGANLPMVLNSLDKGTRSRLNQWIKDSFGFTLELTKNDLHYAISIKEPESENFHNVSDMGFGYSQILPVIVSIWLERERAEVDQRRLKQRATSRAPGKKQQTVIVIEQPELHLHPELQHKFGRAICKIAKSQEGEDFCFIIETHSKHIIDAIGESVEGDVLENHEVNIATFEKDSDGYTRTSLSGFDEDGYLINWPAGFLSP
ncbi:hypothetical protein EI534_11385 [Pseudomonas frederiksbergensis]|nr:hypothetical protein [Pseudomonas frederiksbergensis]